MKIFLKPAFYISILVVLTSCKKETDDDFYIVASSFTMDDLKFEVNKEGYILRKIREYEGKVVELTEYIYDKNNLNYISRITISNYSSNTHFISNFRNTYNDYNLITQCINGSEIWNFYYDDLNRLVKQERKYNYDDNYSYEYYSYSYQESGKLYSRYDSCLYFELGLFIWENKYIYNGDNVIKIIGSNESYSDSICFYYDPNGNIESVLDNNSTEYIQYDEYGRFTECFSNYSDIPFTTFKYDFNYKLKPFLFNPRLYECYLLKIPPEQHLYGLVSPATYNK